MLHPLEIKPDIYWVGGVDWNERNFHGYTTDRGSTYNAYLILDEEITLIDTAKESFADDLIKRISVLCNPSEIRYIISNHVEQDHSGSLRKLLELAPQARVIASAPQGVNGLKAHYGSDFDLEGVKTGDTLCIGKRTLEFIQCPMVHWPDNMTVYSKDDKILFSNDAFGQHFASSKHFDDEVGLHEVLEQATKYYANIVMPYSMQVQRLLQAVQDLDFDMIAPAHGVIWRSHVQDIVSKYHSWSNNESEEYALVIFDSMWHATERMAVQIVEAFIEQGITARLFDLKYDHISDIMTEVLKARYIAVGSPTLNNMMMPTVAAFLTYMRGLAPKKRASLAFGSFGWAPAGPKQVYESLEQCGFDMLMPVCSHQWSAHDDYLAELQSEVLTALDAYRKREAE